MLAVGVWTTGWVRGRAAVRTYATLVESAVNVKKTAFARGLELLRDEETFSSEAGHRTTDALGKVT